MKDRRKDTETWIAAILFLSVWGKDLIARKRAKLPQIVLKISYLEHKTWCWMKVEEVYSASRFLQQIATSRLGLVSGIDTAFS